MRLPMGGCAMTPSLSRGCATPWWAAYPRGATQPCCPKRRTCWGYPTITRRLASAVQLAALNERSLKDLALLVIYIDGIVVDDHHIIVAVASGTSRRAALLALGAAVPSFTELMRLQDSLLAAAQRNGRTGCDVEDMRGARVSAAASVAPSR
jgi:hypothetical protein